MASRLANFKSAGHTTVFQSEQFRRQMKMKRLLDLSIAIPSLIFFFPIMVLAGIAVKITSKGPAIFAQKRWGVDESQFLCFKLRTMYSNTVRRIDGGSAVDAATWKDTRKLERQITPVGRCLRRTSIDELPQLFNILRDEMSIVGPRPVPVDMLDGLSEIRRIRCSVKPGLTGLWQVKNRRNTLNILDMFADDHEYIQNFRIRVDLKIIAATFRVLLLGKGEC